MIPHTFPDRLDTGTGRREMVVYELASIVGLTRWVDYIPVKVATPSATAQGTTNSGGYQPRHTIADITGLSAWKDYIPVYIDAAATKPWVCGSDGYIPIGDSA